MAGSHHGMAHGGAKEGVASTLQNVQNGTLFLFFLYGFLLSIQLMGTSFKLFGADFAQTLLNTTSDPFTGLFIGLFATAVTQSSSMTTSIVVGMVAGGAFPLANAIPIIMGANMGTTVTNTLVSLGHIGNRKEFKRAFGASIVHDIFNLLSVAIIFPIHYFTNYLETASLAVTSFIAGSEGMSFSSPLKVITKPVANAMVEGLGSSGALALAVAVVLLFLSLRYMVVMMKRILMGPAKDVFEKSIFKTPYHGLGVGLLITAVIQSSSVTTSLIVPLAGIGVIGLHKVLPYTMGANIGTTVTALLAALTTSSPMALAVGVSHLLFNISGIALFWGLRVVPVSIAEWIAALTEKNRAYAIAYLLLFFFVIPLGLIFITR